MERTQIFDLMGELKLYGMRAAFDEIMVTAVKRQHEPQHIVGDLLSAEINEKQARSIKYQLTIAKLPLAKDLDDFSSKARRSIRRSSTISPAAASSPAAQRRARRRHRHRQNPPGHCNRQKLHPIRRPRSLLQRGRPR